MELREEKIILIATKKSIEFLKPSKAIEYFVDITFKLTPRVHRPYKIMTISCLDKEEQTPRLVCLIALLYLDTISYTKIFSYLKENYFFYPKVIHLDFETPLRNSIINSGIYEQKPLLVSCFFHFSANVRRKMEQLKITGKKFNKSAIEILRNIELICFIKPNNIKKFSEILNENLNKNEKNKKLYQCIYDYYTKKNPEIHNHSFIIDYAKDKNKEKYLKKLYLTNNIEESMHSKINILIKKVLQIICLLMQFKKYSLVMI